MDPSWRTSQPKSAENQDVQVPGTLAVKGTSDIPDPDNRPQILGIAAPNLGQQSLICITAPGSSSSQITQAGSFAGYSRPMLNAMLQDDIPFVVPSALVNHTAGQHAGPSIGTFSDLPAGWSQVPISILRLTKKRAAESDTMPQLPLPQGATLPPDLPRGSQCEQFFFSKSYASHRNSVAKLLISLIDYQLRDIPAMHSADGTSVQLTQNHFLPLGGASNMVTSNMALPPSTSVTPDKYGPVTAPFQPNGPGAEASKAGSVTEACIQRQSATVVVKNSCTKEASITPRKANGVRGQHPQELNCLAGEGSAEDNTQKYPGMQNQAKTRTNQSDDPALLRSTVSNKCTFTQIEMQISEVEQLETIINENETQVQRSKPRRKKHRPKVIREGKPSKTQETAVSTPKVPPNSTVKRTNIPKKRSISSLGNSPGPSGDKSISSAEALTFKGQATSVRRRLQFEHEGHAVSGEQRTMTNSQHHSQEKLHHPQALKCSVTQSEVGQGLQLEIENEPGGIVSGPSHKLNENSPGYPQPQAPSAASGYFGRAVQLDNSRDMALKQDNVSSAHNLDTTRQFVSQIDERLGTNSLNVDGLQIYCSARLLSETGSAESQMSKVQQVENQKHEQHSNWRSISIGTRNSILRTTAKIVASCQAGGIKKKRSICSSKIPSDLIKDLEKNTSQACQTSSQSGTDALPETTHLKFTTKKRLQRARLHSSSCVEPNMENKNRASTGNIFSSRSNGSSSSKPLQGSLPWTLIGYTPHNTSTNVDICNKLPKGCLVSTSAMPYMDSSRSVQKNLDLSSEQVYRNETHLSVAASPNIVPLRKTSDLQNALVPYVGSIDPYGRAWNLVKKQRAKVDLDFESTRAWNLLMGKTVNPVDGADVEKEKWWQQERNVFQGRANSFIARMRLVQGGIDIGAMFLLKAKNTCLFFLSISIPFSLF